MFCLHSAWPFQARSHFEVSGRLAREQLDPCGEAASILGAATSALELGEPNIAIDMLSQEIYDFIRFFF